MSVVLRNAAPEPALPTELSGSGTRTPTAPGAVSALTGVLRGGQLRSVFQPIVDLSTRSVVAFEALARGPAGELASPERLFNVARSVGRVAELDRLCRQAAFTGAVESGLSAPVSLFVNVEPEALDVTSVRDLAAQARDLPPGVQVVVELTERALGGHPAELLATVARIRALGWGVALDDVGAEPLSLAFMSLLCPDVVKLDLRLVQQHPGREVAQIMNAVNAYAERSGAVILAEGIETDRHLTLARALGARLGQGWLLGRPVPNPSAPGGTALRLPTRTPRQETTATTPFGCLPPHVELRRSPKSLLIEVSKQLEREAMRLGRTAVVAAAFQHVRHFTPATATRYQRLVDRTGFVCALGEGLPDEPLPGLRGVNLPAGDPVRGEWDLIVLDPHFAVALLARDLSDTGPDLDRMFEFALTYDRPTVEHAAHALLSRVEPCHPPT